MVNVPDQWDNSKVGSPPCGYLADILLCRLQNTVSKLAMFVISLYLKSRKRKQHGVGVQEVLWSGPGRKVTNLT